ncbi:MAG: TadE/TadG family type IV pilus assembly protein [Litorimonas sp.]
MKHLKLSLKQNLYSHGLKPFKFIAKKGRNFKADKSGVAAIEFALIAPIMIGMYFGLAEIASAISIDRRVSHTANVVGDLATQSTELLNADVTEVMAAAVRVLDLPNVSDVTIDITSYDLDTNGDVRDLGRATLNQGQALQPFNPDTLDPRILNATSGVVVARIAYSYTPLQLRFTNADIDLKETFLLKPRRSSSVPIGDDPAVQVNCTATNVANVTCG